MRVQRSPSENKYRFVKGAKELIGVPYKYGGQDANGIDCSGLVVVLLQSLDIFEKGEDYTADGLWRKYQHLEVAAPELGVLAFWFKDDAAYHVTICYNDWLCISAHRGSGNVKTLEDAKKARAFVTMVALSTWKEKPKFVKLF